MKTRDGLTALDISANYLTVDRHVIYFNNFVQENTKYGRECFQELLRAHFDKLQKNYSTGFSSILHTAVKIGLEFVKDVYEIALSIIPGLRKSKYLLLDEQDAAGNTPLHVAAINGRERVVKYLVGLGADINIKNKENNTPMLTALFSIKIFKDNRCNTTVDGLFTLCGTTVHDEITSYLIWLQKSSISKCDDDTAVLLNIVIVQRMPLSLYTLLKIGVDIHCGVGMWSSAFLKHVTHGGREVSEVLKMFEVTVPAECGISFRLSELHLISYTSVSHDFGNFFKPSRNNKTSPFQRLIDRHPKGVRILDECYDAEGYLPIHRAAQGGNLVAIKWFKSVGVNTQLKTRNGLTALDISILYIGDASHREPKARLTSGFHVSFHWRHPPLTPSKYRTKVFKELLALATTRTNPAFQCGPALEGLSPLHIAAVKGMSVLQYVHKEASEIFPSLPINCVNKHRLDPLYFVQFYESLRNEGLIDKYSAESSDAVDEMTERGKKGNENNLDSKFSHSGDTSVPAPQYPDREVDYIMAFNYLYRDSSFGHELYRHLFELKFKDVRIDDCPSYYDNFPKYEGAESIQEEADLSQCGSKIPYNYYRTICMREINEYRIFAWKCNEMLKILQIQMQFKRRNRRFSQLILRRLGWSNDDLQEKNIDIGWPFYFLHKKSMKEYEAFKYIATLNEALEVAYIYFHNDHIYDNLITYP